MVYSFDPDIAPMARSLLSLLSFVGFLIAARVTAQTELLLVVGEERSLRASNPVARAVVGEPGSCEVRVEDNGKTVVLLARRPGATGLKLLDAAGSPAAEYLLRIFASSQELLRRDVSERLGGLPGIEVQVEGARVVMRGRAASLDDLNRVRELGREFPEVLDLVAFEASPAAPSAPGTGVPVRVGELAFLVPAASGWTIQAQEGGFRAEHSASGARVEARATRLSRGMPFKEAQALIVADFGQRSAEKPVLLETRGLRLGEHEASLSEWTDTKGNSSYLLIATATPFPINLEYVLLQGSFPAVGTTLGESYLADILRSLGDSSFSARPGTPYVHSRAGFILRYPSGWTVGGETAEAAGFYQNPDNRPVVNVTAERLPGSYPGGAGLARAAAALFQRARVRGAFRVESESDPAGGGPWQRRIVFEGARPLRQLQAILQREDRAYALIFTAEPELFPIHEPAFQQTLASFSALGGGPRP